MASEVLTLGLSGAKGNIVTAECIVTGSFPGFEIIGLPDTAVKESRDRIRATVKSLGLYIPESKVTINLAPAGQKKEGAVYDLPMLIALLSELEKVKSPDKKTAFIGELSLTGELRPVRGVLSRAIWGRTFFGIILSEWRISPSTSLSKTKTASALCYFRCGCCSFFAKIRCKACFPILTEK
ncbi:MAG: hypothetical protein E7473_09940 [Ruminococcaceae bacterium]|nr:hypothetical protein [Oscillospiraceae bacterium]